MPSFDVITIGSALRDVLYVTDALCVRKNLEQDPTKEKLLCVEYGAKIHSNDVLFEFGGGGANTALNFRALGLRTGIVASVGEDSDGDAMRRYLHEHNVATRFLHRAHSHRTGFSFLLIDKNTREHSAFVFYGASGVLHIPALLLHKPRTTWYYCASLNSPQWKKELRAIFTQGIVHRAWNPGQLQLRAGYKGLRSFFSATDVLLLNNDEARELVLSFDPHHSMSIPAMLRTLVGWGVGIAVITQGIRGSSAMQGKEKRIFSAKPSRERPKDTTGAGDCFGSAFVAGLLRYHGNIQKSLELATTCASRLVQKQGAQQGLTLWRNLPKHLQATS